MISSATYIELRFNSFSFPQFLDFLETLREFNLTGSATVQTLELEDRIRNYYLNYEASTALYLKPDEEGGHFLSLRIWSRDIGCLFKAMMQVCSENRKARHGKEDYERFTDDLIRNHSDRVWIPARQKNMNP